MTSINDVLQRLRGPVLVLAAVLLLAQGQLLLGLVVGWTAFEQLRSDEWLMGKLAALFAGMK